MYDVEINSTVRFRKHLTFFRCARAYFFSVCLERRDVSATNVRLRSATVGKISRIFNRGRNIIVLLASPTCLLWRVHAYTRSALGAHHVTTDQCFSIACYCSHISRLFRPFSTGCFVMSFYCSLAFSIKWLANICNLVESIKISS